MSGSKERDIQESVQKLAGTYLKDIVSIILCKVDSVDVEQRTCDCTSISDDADTEIPSVQLMAESDDGLVVFPKVGSTVIVAYSTRGTAFVLMYSTIDKVQFFDGSYDGIVKVIELTEKLNNLENKVNDIITSYSNHVHAATLAVSGSSASGTTNPVTPPPAIAPLSPTQQSEIENELITHGKNN